MIDRRLFPKRLLSLLLALALALSVLPASALAAEPALMALDSWQEQVDFASSWLHRSLDTMAREYL